MQYILDNKKSALVMIVILAVGSISIMGMTHIAFADLNGQQCVFFSCGNVNITGGTSGGGGGGQPKPNTATLIVTKVVSGCPGEF